jgi:carboxymethylenebutenolidase
MAPHGFLLAVGRILSRMAFIGYLTSEVVEDWSDGLISRREALRRLALLGFSASTAASAMALAAAPVRAQSTGPSPTVVLPPGAPGLPGGPIAFAGPRGELQGHFSSPPDPAAGILVIHENRGLTDHIRSVADRLAGAGYAALAIDLLSEEGGTAAIGDEGAVGGILGGASPERLVEDMRAGLDELERRVPEGSLGMIGFCFGGAMTWLLLDAGEPRLAAAIPFYGPAPEAPDFSGDTAAVMGVYAELDDRVNASQDRVRAALEAAGLEHELRVYPGVDHAFFNDTGGRYDPTQAALAWDDASAWFATYLRTRDATRSEDPDGT